MYGLCKNGGLLRTNRKFVILLSMKKYKVVDRDIISHPKQYGIDCDNVSHPKQLDIDCDNVSQHKFITVSRTSRRVLTIAKSDY